MIWFHLNHDEKFSQKGGEKRKREGKEKEREEEGEKVEGGRL